jgi:secreted trypsin-like serine protease
MLVELAADARDVAPVPIASASPSAGQAAVIAGFGLTEQNTAGTRLFITTTVAQANAGGLTVNSGADAGACVGDSGGPLLVRSAAGWQLAGVLSEGSAYCTLIDVFVDATAIRGWVATNTAP